MKEVSKEELEHIQKVINLASEMRELLISCRSEQINYSLAKKIDDLLSRASKLD